MLSVFVIELSELGRRHIPGLTEGFAEGGIVGKARLQRYICDGKPRVNQKLLSAQNPFADQVLVKGLVRVIAKEPGKVEPGEAGKVSRLF